MENFESSSSRMTIRDPRAVLGQVRILNFLNLSFKIGSQANFPDLQEIVHLSKPK